MKQHQENTKKLQGNIRKNYIYRFLSNLNLTRGIWMLYLAYKGLTLFEIGLLESVFHVTSFTMEIPTGAIADLYGRKTSRILGRFMEIISIVLMLLGGHFLWFAVSFTFSALSYNLESGAGEALVYDSMKELGTEKGYMKIKGREEVIFQLTSVIALLVGGYIATLDYDFVYKVVLVVAVVTLIQSFGFVEPTVNRVEKTDNPFKSFARQIKDSIGVIRNDKRIVFLVISTEFFAALVTTTFLYVQNYMNGIGLTELEIGAVLAITSVGAALGAAFAHKLEKYFGFKGLLTVMPLVGTLGFVALSFKMTTVIAVMVVVVYEAIMFVVIGDYINRLIPSEQRATILSFQSMVFSFFMILVFPVIGRLGDAYGLLTAFRLIAVLAIMMLVWVIASVHRDDELAFD